MAEKDLAYLAGLVVLAEGLWLIVVGGVVLGLCGIVALIAIVWQAFQWLRGRA